MQGFVPLCPVYGGQFFLILRSAWVVWFSPGSSVTFCRFVFNSVFLRRFLFSSRRVRGTLQPDVLLPRLTPGSENGRFSSPDVGLMVFIYRAEKFLFYPGGVSPVGPASYPPVGSCLRRIHRTGLFPTGHLFPPPPDFFRPPPLEKTNYVTAPSPLFPGSRVDK